MAHAVPAILEIIFEKIPDLLLRYPQNGVYYRHA